MLTLVGEYIAIADGYPESIVGRVTMKYRRGQVPDQSTEFPPKPPAFAKALRSEPFQDGDEQNWAKARAGITDAPRLEYSNPDRETKQEAMARRGRKYLEEFLKDWDEENGWHEYEENCRPIELSRRRVAEYCRRKGGSIVPGLGSHRKQDAAR